MLEVISGDTFNSICDSKKIKTRLSSGKTKLKVFERTPGEIIKVFYPKKKYFSSDKIKPYAVRFCDNAKRLQACDIVAPKINKLQYCPDLKTYLVHYEKLNGEDTRSLIHHGDQKIIFDILSFVANLHNKGIFFRPIHLANVLRLSDGRFALLDINDIAFKRTALSFFLRYRNLRHLFLNRDDRNTWIKFGIHRFLDYYCQMANLSYLEKKCFYFLAQRWIMKSH